MTTRHTSAMSALRGLPSVERILQTHGASVLSDRYGRSLTLDAVRLTLEEARDGLKAEPEAAAPEIEAILSRAEVPIVRMDDAQPARCDQRDGSASYTPISGVLRYPTAAIAAMNEVAAGYSNLEFDLETGKRGERLKHAESALQTLTGAEAALVVNNNAAAVMLVLCALASRKRVIIARSQLIEIGGGFRMPEVMKQSGARLVEVGTTNKVRLADYEQELPNAALVMRAHRSNFKMVGFTEEPKFEDIVQAAHRVGVTVVDDLGSGALLDTAKYGMAHEPTVQESLSAGADVVCFSGDKLIGGPQAGIIVGSSEHVAKLRKHPLARALRADKTCLAGIAATLTHYLRSEAEREIPVWKMLSTTLEDVSKRATRWAATLGAGEVRASESTLGGGSLPGESMPSVVLSLRVKSINTAMKQLREQDPPIIARTEKDRILLDPRTVLIEQEGEAAARSPSR